MQDLKLWPLQHEVQHVTHCGAHPASRQYSTRDSPLLLLCICLGRIEAKSIWSTKPSLTSAVFLWTLFQLSIFTKTIYWLELLFNALSMAISRSSKTKGWRGAMRPFRPLRPGTFEIRPIAIRLLRLLSEYGCRHLRRHYICSRNCPIIYQNLESPLSFCQFAFIWYTWVESLIYLNIPETCFSYLTYSCPLAFKRAVLQRRVCRKTANSFIGSQGFDATAAEKWERIRYHLSW